MAYKTIMTVWDGAGGGSEMLNLALDLTRREDAHLDVLCLGIDRTQPGYYYSATTPVMLEQGVARAQADAAELEAEVNAQLKGEEVAHSVITSIAQWSGIGQTIAWASRFSDLVVLPRPYGEQSAQERAAVLESVLFDAHVPALVVPPGIEKLETGRVAIAWDESAESLNAVRAALPMLVANKSKVEILMVDPKLTDESQADPGARLSIMLARHGLDVTVTLVPKTMSRVSDHIRTFARDKEAGLIVMGAYGHSRFREAILGGATRDMLEEAQVPVLMAH